MVCAAKWPLTTEAGDLKALMQPLVEIAKSKQALSSFLTNSCSTKEASEELRQVRPAHVPRHCTFHARIVVHHLSYAVCQGARAVLREG